MSTVFRLLPAAILLAVCLPGSQAGGKKDELQGTWLVKSIIVNGKKADAKEFKDAKLIVDKERFEIFQGGKRIAEGTFKTDASKKPKQIDIDPVSKDKKEKTTKLLAIYKIEGDKLTVCGVREGAERPGDFSSKKGSNRELVVYERKK